VGQTRFPFLYIFLVPPPPFFRPAEAERLRVQFFRKRSWTPKTEKFSFHFFKRGARKYKIRKVEKIFLVLELKFFPKEFQAESLGGGES
jgi:hypothetical protein